jgi:hypothetical protein
MKFTISRLALTLALLPSCLFAQGAFAQDALATGTAGVAPEQGTPIIAQAPVEEAVVAVPRDGALLWTPEEQKKRAEAAISAPLSVNGVVISSEVIRTHLVQKVGRMAIESRKLDLLIAAEIEMRVSGGADPAAFQLSSEVLDAAYKNAVDKIMEKYPAEKLEDILAANKLDKDSLGRQLTQTKRFDLVFLPDNPELWPATTVAALEASMQVEMIEKLKENYKVREASGASAANDPGQEMFKGLMRRMVIQALMSTATVESPSDGLPAGVLQRVNGHDTLLSDIYPQVVGLIHPSEVARVRLYLARMEASRQALVASGSWLTEEEFAPVIEAERAVGEGTPWNLEMITLTMKRYPTMDAYKAILHGVKSYEKMLGESLTDETLQNWLPRVGRLLGLGEVDCQILLVGAWDAPRNGWKDNGWVEAEEKALSIAANLAAASGENWDELLEANSEFFDPPLQPGAPAPNASDLKNKGRFGLIHRNRLMQMLNESEYTAFVDGSSISDTVYYDQEVGTIDGPFLGLQGYYFTRVDARTPAKKPILLSDPNMRTMVLQDFLMQSFIGFSNEALANAEVVGL